MLPRNCGPSILKLRRGASPVSVHSPFRVAISSVVLRAGRAPRVLLLFAAAISDPLDSASRVSYRDRGAAASILDILRARGVEIGAERCDSLGLTVHNNG